MREEALKLEPSGCSVLRAPPDSTELCSGHVILIKRGCLHLRVRNLGIRSELPMTRTAQLRKLSNRSSAVWFNGRGVGLSIVRSGPATSNDAPSVGT